MFTGFMANAWLVGTMVAVVAGVVGFFVVLRGSAFPAHAIPNGAFAGAAGATLVGVDPLLGLAAFSVLAALGIGALGRRGRHDVATALVLVLLLALGALFLSRGSEYEPEVYSLLFGEILGVSTAQLLPVALLGAACLAGTALLYRRLLLSSVVPEVAQVRGVRAQPTETAFLVVLALATAMTVPVVGALLIFSLMIGPPAAARALASRPSTAVALSVALAVATLWASIAGAYLSDWPVGFYVGVLGAACYAAGRGWAGWRRRPGRPGRAARLPFGPGAAAGTGRAVTPACPRPGPG